MESRANNPPCMFAHADLEAAALGMKLYKIIPALLDGYKMLLQSPTASGYGKIVSWAKDASSLRALKPAEAFEPGKGLIVLKIQRENLSFLMRCCQTILQDHPIEKMLKLDTSEEISAFNQHLSSKGCNTKGKELVFDAILEPQNFLRKNSSFVLPKELPSLASLALEAPYRVPGSLNFEHLLDIVKARHGAAEDQIWALREDPGYFLDRLGDHFEHRQENVLDAARKPHPNFKNPRIWDFVASALVQAEYGALCLWGEASRQLTNLCLLQDKYAKTISAKNKLPREFLVAFLGFRSLLLKMSNNLRMRINEAIAASPPLRSSFVRVDSGKAKTIVTNKSDPSGDVLIKTLLEIGEDKLIPYLNLPIFMDYLQHLLKDPKHSSRVSSHLLGLLSDLDIVAEFLRQLGLYQPWAATMDQDLIIHEREVQLCWAASERVKVVNIGVLSEIKVASIITPIQTKFHYPSNKRTKQSVTHMRNAESTLEKFWSVVDTHFKTKTGKTLVEVHHGSFAQDQPVWRTPEWVDRPKVPTHNLKSVKREALCELANHMSVGKVPNATTAIKTKLKTKGVPAPEAEKVESTPKLQETPHTNPMIISQAALKVFSTLFFTPNQSDTPGEIAWRAFLSAMASAGFSMQKLYGSIWQFTPSPEMGLNRSIQFHEPHPTGKISFTEARRIGRRLYRAYGWNITCFEVE